MLQGWGLAPAHGCSARVIRGRRTALGKHTPRAASCPLPGAPRGPPMLCHQRDCVQRHCSHQRARCQLSLPCRCRSSVVRAEVTAGGWGGSRTGTEKAQRSGTGSVCTLGPSAQPRHSCPRAAPSAGPPLWAGAGLAEMRPTAPLALRCCSSSLAVAPDSSCGFHRHSNVALFETFL